MDLHGNAKITQSAQRGAESRVEHLNKRIIRGRPRPAEGEFNKTSMRPSVQDLAGALGTIIDT